MVVDPFLGSGISAIEAVQLRRRMIGIDVNPSAVRLARLLVAPPSVDLLQNALKRVAATAEARILDSYMTREGKAATHYVWHRQVLEKVWVAPDEGRTRMEMQPTEHDLALLNTFASYQPRHLPIPAFFRIPGLTPPPISRSETFLQDGRCAILNCCSTPLANSPQTRKKPSDSV